VDAEVAPERRVLRREAVVVYRPQDAAYRPRSDQVMVECAPDVGWGGLVKAEEPMEHTVIVDPGDAEGAERGGVVVA